MTEITGPNRLEIPEYLFIPSEYALFIGRVATDAYTSNQYQPAAQNEISHFSELITDPSIDIPLPKFPRERFRHWTLEDYRNYGKWIIPLTRPLPGEISDHVMLSRSYRLGAGPSKDRIIAKHRFGSVINFVRKSGGRPEVRYGEYDDWSFEDYVNHIRRVIEEEDTMKITQTLLWRRIRDGHHEPSPAVIRTNVNKLTDANGLTLVLKAAGVRSKVRLTDEEYRLIGLEQTLLNGGEPPTVDQTNQFAKLGKGHNFTTIFERFGSASTYRGMLREDYRLLIDGLEEGSFEDRISEAKRVIELRRQALLNSLVPSGYVIARDDKNGDVPLCLTDDFVERIEQLETVLANPPPISEMLRERSERGWSNGVGHEFSEVVD